MSGIRVSVRSDLKVAVAKFEVLNRKAVDASAVRALNRTATTVRAMGSRRIRERYNLKAGVIKAGLKIVKANLGRLSAEIVASGKAIPLIEFGARPVNAWNIAGRKRRPGGGVSVKVTKSRKLLPHRFIATMPGGHVGVFERVGNTRTPIRQLFSLSLPTAFTQRQIMDALKAVAAQRFKLEFERDLAFRARANG